MTVGGRYRWVYYRVLSIAWMDALVRMCDYEDEEDPSVQRPSSWVNFKAYVFYLNNHLVLPFYISMMGYSLIWGHETSLLKWLHVLSFFLNGLIIGIKSWWWVSNLPTMRKSIMLDQDDFASTRFAGEAARELLSAEVRSMLRANSYLTTSMCLVIVSWVVQPLFAESASDVKLLPHHYPFPLTDRGPRIAVYLMEAYMVWSSATSMLAVNQFLMVCVLMVCSQLRILALALSEATTSSDIKLLVNDHQRLIRISHEIRRLMSPVLLVQILNSAVTLSIAVFKVVLATEDTDGGVSGTAHVLDVLKFVNYLLVLSFELLYYCWFSTCLQTANCEVGVGAYSSRWYDMDRARAKDVAIIMSMSDKPITLTAYSMAELELTTFVNGKQLTPSELGHLCKSFVGPEKGGGVILLQGGSFVARFEAFGTRRLVAKYLGPPYPASEIWTGFGYLLSLVVVLRLHKSFRNLLQEARDLGSIEFSLTDSSLQVQVNLMFEGGET
ncbi:hypothetical protein AAG570_000873 [Ranatra chinensis]|uniref:Odorant receptor n=1 Tax=Ranatra chinensis TaxID=642074 RepID=A0ABD0YYC9_9HEMI